MSHKKILSSQNVYLGGPKLQPAIVRINGHFIEEIISEFSSNFLDFLSQYRGRYAQYDYIDLQEHLVTPAFVNAHTHCAMSFFRSISVDDAVQGNMVEDLFYHVESHLTPEDIRAFTRMGAVENILNGVGMVWDHYYHGVELAQGFADVGLPAIVAPTLQDLSGPGKELWQNHIEQTKTLNAISWKAKHIYPAFGPHATDTVSEQLWDLVSQEASSLNIPLHFHLAQSKEEYARAIERYGKTPPQWLAHNGVLSRVPKSLMVHGIYLTHEDLLLIKDSGHSLGFCPHSQMVFDRPAAFWEWMEHEIPLVIATDCVASNDSMNIMKELRTAAGFVAFQKTFSDSYQKFRKSGHLSDLTDKNLSLDFMPQHDLLKTVFANPGTLHPQIKAGVLEAGALANILVWNMDHPSLWPGSSLRSLIYPDSISAIECMMISGQWLGGSGSWRQEWLKKIDYQGLLIEAKSLLRELKNRCGLK